MFQDGHWWQQQEDGKWKIYRDFPSAWRKKELKALIDAIQDNTIYKGPDRVFANNPGEVDVRRVYPDLVYRGSTVKYFEEVIKPGKDPKKKVI